MMEWLIDFVFSEEEQKDLSPHAARRMLRQAARQTYQSPKYQRRGEFGELLLHIVLRQHFSSIPAIRKIYFKDSPNDTVKGFDAVHVVSTGDYLELWLGEVKFYSDLSKAIADVVAELHVHSATDYLRTEFTLIMNKVDSSFEHHAELGLLLDPNTSLDQVFKRVRIPVLLTYDSRATAQAKELCAEYIAAAQAELLAAHSRFVGSGLPAELAIHFILVPLATKAELINALHAKLSGMQV